MIWQKGHVAKPKATPSGKGKRGFVRPAPIHQSASTSSQGRSITKRSRPAKNDPKEMASTPKIAEPACEAGAPSSRPGANRPGPPRRHMMAEQSTDSIVCPPHFSSADVSGYPCRVATRTKARTSSNFIYGGSMGQALRA
jgi:hypothetical protein